MSRMRAYAEVRRAQSPGQVFRRLFAYFAPFKRELGLFLVLLILGTLAGLASPYLIGVAVDQFIDPGDLTMPGWLQWVVGSDTTRLTGLARVMLLLLGSYLVSWAASVFQFRMLVRVSQRVLLKMRTQVFDQVQALSLSFFDQHEAGDLMSRLVNDTQVINDVFGPGITRLLRMVLSMIGIVITMVSLNWRLSLVSYAVLPIVVLVTIYFSQRVRSAYRRTRETVGEVSSELQENIAGVREVQAFAREAETAEEFRAVNLENRAANVRAETIMAAFVPLLDLMSVTATAAVIGYGGYLVLAYTPPLVSVGVIVSFLNYVGRFYDPIRELANLFGQFQSALAGAERIFELLDRDPQLEDKPDAVDLPPAQGRVMFDQVSFAYVEGEPVLDGVSIDVEPGEMLAIVGETGAGKTTIVNLLMRFYDVTGGAIRVDNHDVRDVVGASLRRQIGIVLQDTFLFSGSVRENIRYGRLDATDEEVMQAAKAANAHQFIERLSQGYDTEVGERGATLSQGNRQLLAIARALLQDPRILILDEATSSVDTRTERLIQGALEELLAGRTSVVIAHRLSTIRHADKIVVLDKGHVVERGNHASLMAARGVYYDLYMSQFRREQDLQTEPAMPTGSPETPSA